MSRHVTGGSELTGNIQRALASRNYSLTGLLDTYMARQVAERLCYVSRNYKQEVAEAEATAADAASKEVQLAPGSRLPSVSLGPADRFEAAEGLFRPELWGRDQPGLARLVARAVAECGMDVRKEMAASVYLSGGTTLLPGLKARLEAELCRLLAPMRPRVHASPYRYHAAFLGASVHAASPAYEQSRVTREQWQQGKIDVAKMWVL